VCGHRTISENRVRLDRLDAARLAAEGAEHGLRAEGARLIAPTDDHVGSEVVVLRG
jgi:hypothetical protein